MRMPGKNWSAYHYQIFIKDQWFSVQELRHENDRIECTISGNESGIMDLLHSRKEHTIIVETSDACFYGYLSGIRVESNTLPVHTGSGHQVHTISSYEIKLTVNPYELIGKERAAMLIYEMTDENKAFQVAVEKAAKEHRGG